MSDSQEGQYSPNAVFIGAGPVGLWTAIQTKLRNPNLRIAMYEKYEEYQRLHMLQLNKNSFKGIPNDERLQEIVNSFSKHVKTSEIEEKLKTYAEELGIKIHYEEVESCKEFAKQFPDDTIIIGADGSHSLVRHEIFDNDLQYEEDLQYVAELKYFVEGSTTKLNPILEAIPVMTYSKFTVQETVGNEKDGMTPITLRFFIDKKTFDELRGDEGTGATFKKPFRYNDLNNGNVPRCLAKSMKAWLSWRKKIKRETRIEFEANNKEKGEKITAINLAVYASKEFITQKHGKTWAIVGDAAAGYPYFRALNAGLLCGTELSIALSNHFSPQSVDQDRVVKFDVSDSFSRSPLEAYAYYVQRRVDKEARDAMVKNSAVNLGRFFVNASVVDNHFSRSKLVQVRDQDEINISEILTFYLLENYQELSDGVKFHEIVDHFTENDLFHAQEFTETLDIAYKTAKLNLPKDYNIEKLNAVANTFKANVYKEILQRQNELRESRWKTAWILTVIGIILPVISHAIVWGWYLYRRYNEPLQTTTITEKEFAKLYNDSDSSLDTKDILNRLNEKDPVNNKHDKPHARKAFVALLDDASDSESIEDSQDVTDYITGVQIISTNWNKQTKRFDQKLFGIKDNVEEESFDSYSVV